MKRGTPEHPKTIRLAKKLGIPIAQAVGTLELLWHWTAKFVPAGDVGRYLDEEIEAACIWEGEPGVLIPALVASRFLDTDDVSRLVVHDWPAHAEASVHKQLARAGHLFADGTEPNLGGLNEKERAFAVACFSAAYAGGRRRPSAVTDGGLPSQAQPEPLPGPAKPEPSQAQPPADRPAGRTGAPGEHEAATREYLALLREASAEMRTPADVLHSRWARTPGRAAPANPAAFPTLPWLRVALERGRGDLLQHRADQHERPRPGPGARAPTAAERTVEAVRAVVAREGGGEVDVGKLIGGGS